MTGFEKAPRLDLMVIIEQDCRAGSPAIAHLPALEATHTQRVLCIFVILNKQHLQIPDRTAHAAVSCVRSDLSVNLRSVCLCVRVCSRLSVVVRER